MSVTLSFHDPWFRSKVFFPVERGAYNRHTGWRQRWDGRRNGRGEYFYIWHESSRSGSSWQVGGAGSDVAAARGCGSGTRISGSSSRTIWSIMKWKALYYLYNSLAPQTISVEPEPKFQAPAPPSKTFRLRLRSSKIAWAPVPQPCCSAIPVRCADILWRSLERHDKKLTKNAFFDVVISSNVEKEVSFNRYVCRCTTELRTFAFNTDKDTTPEAITRTARSWRPRWTRSHPDTSTRMNPVSSRTSSKRWSTTTASSCSPTSNHTLTARPGSAKRSGSVTYRVKKISEVWCFFAWVEKTFEVWCFLIAVESWASMPRCISEIAVLW